MALPSSAVQMRSSAAVLKRLAVGLFGEHRYTSLICGSHAASSCSGSRAPAVARFKRDLDHVGALDARRDLIHAECWAALQDRVAAGAQVRCATARRWLRRRRASRAPARRVTP